MISIARHMDEYDIAQEVRLERKVHKGAFLLLEGSTDIKRLSRFVDDAKCSTVNCYGRLKATKAIELLYDEGFPGVLGLVDADFDRIDGTPPEHEGLIYSVAHDFDMDWITEDIIRKYLDEVGDRQKCESHGSAQAIIDKILLSLKPISVARYFNHTKHISYKLSDIDITKCLSGFSVNIDEYVDLIFENRNASDEMKSAIRGQITGGIKQTYDLRQLTNGHDFICALGVCLRTELGSRRDVHTWSREVEMHIRLLYSDTEFRSSNLYNEICAWTTDNPKYTILYARLF